MKQNNLQVNKIRHSLSHIMAHSIKNLFKEVKFGIGPTIENGFYYDFDLPQSITPEDLPKIEKNMKDLIKKNIEFKKKQITKTEAKKIFKNQPYKLELINEIKENKVSVYKSGDFIDLCSGPHIKSTKEINPKAFKLTRVAGAYWKGDEKNTMLQRIYGIAFETEKELKDYLKKQEEAEKRDHRMLGQKLKLFIFNEKVGCGLPLWLPKGSTLRHTIEEYLYKELNENGYQWVTTPHIANLELWKASGHWQLYRESMYSPIQVEKEQYLLKPMNCPFHVHIYNSEIRSYKDLPIRFAELGTVYRYERSGTLHGLTRVRGFTQDDAHIICAPSQLAKELKRTLKHGFKMLKDFGFKDYDIYLSTRPEKFAGTPKNWEKATKALKQVLAELKLKYKVDPGGGVFYGPKIDIKIKDSLNREWQCTTVQFDFNLPEKFDMNYVDENGKKEKPYMIHRALLGSIERFIGVLLEHYAGALPLWLSPIQAYVIPIGTKHKKYAKELAKNLEKENIRIKLKDENETVGKKIRQAEIQKIPYSLIIGDKEVKAKTASIRNRKKGDLGSMKIEKIIEKIKKEIRNKN
ncbi:MAG: threonine--tRNA ligase [Candidatus Portnoybacteria bacterium]|nr:threonine--tRNA ligase [Candidatus Portnoybacteria bacterium]